MSAIFQAVDQQLRNIWICAVRDVQIKNRSSPIGALSSLVEPLALILMMTAAFSSIRLKVPDVGDYVMLLLATGIIVLSAFRGGALGAERGYRSMKRVLALRPLKTIDLLAAGTLSELIATTTLFLAITAFFAIVFQADVPQNLLLTIVPFVCNALIGLGVGCVNLVIKSYFAFWTKIFAVATGPLNLISGMFYTADQVPHNIQAILYFNPFMHSTELCRTAFFPDYTSTFFDPYYYGGWVIGALVIGLFCERFFRSRLLSQK